ncbi:MAG: TetR/AcrR family transcriptional regulator [Deltaproteobacteria bacterium]|nr:TetR/AcrR family transcriptional regulator [Deltaproteobacteria bacterium]
MDADQPQTKQASRSAQTRARIVAAAVACVDADGFPGMTFQRVAREAGVTVGAVQHYFASKKEMLNAVLENSFQHFTRCLGDLPAEGLPDLPLDERISIFVDRAWLHCSSPAYQSTIQILLAIRSDIRGSREHWSNSPLIDTAAQAQELWRSIFHDLAISDEDHTQLFGFVVSTLSAIAIADRLAPNSAGLETQLTYLKVLVQTIFEKAPERVKGASFGA